MKAAQTVSRLEVLVVGKAGNGKLGYIVPTPGLKRERTFDSPWFPSGGGGVFQRPQYPTAGGLAERRSPGKRKVLGVGFSASAHFSLLINFSLI